MAATSNKQVSQHDAANREAAKVILADPSKYGGEDAALVTWAHFLLSKQKRDSSQSEIYEIPDR